MANRRAGGIRRRIQIRRLHPIASPGKRSAARHVQRLRRAKLVPIRVAVIRAHHAR